MRGAAVLAISACLLGAAGYAVTVSPGRAEQPAAGDAVIRISAITAAHDDRPTHRDRERSRQATDRRNSTEAGLNAGAVPAGLDASAGGTARDQAAASATQGSTFDLAVRSLPGQGSRTAACP